MKVMKTYIHTQHICTHVIFTRDLNNFVIESTFFFDTLLRYNFYKIRFIHFKCIILF